jgi:O-antigen/teichoic acid export membrane protein
MQSTVYTMRDARGGISAIRETLRNLASFRVFGSQLRLNMVAGTLSAVAQVVIASLSYPLYLYYLGYEAYGLWLSLSVVLTLAQFGNIGIAPAVSKVVAEEFGREDLEAVRSYVSTALLALLSTGILIVIVTILSRPYLIASLKLSPSNAANAHDLLPFMAILSVSVIQTEALNAVLAGLGRTDLANYSQVASRVIVLTCSATLLHYGFGINSLLVANFLGCSVLYASTTFAVTKITGSSLLRPSTFSLNRLRQLVTFGGAMFTCSLLGMLVSPFNRFILARYVGLSSVPIYELCYTASMQARGVIESGLRALMPEISRIRGHAVHDGPARVEALNRQAFRLILSAGVPMYLLLLLLCAPLLQIWLGARFSPELPKVFRILLVATFASLLGVPVYYTLIGLGRVRELVVSNCLQSASNVGVTILFLTIGVSLSAATASLATAVGMAVSSLYLTMFLKKRFSSSQ